MRKTLVLMFFVMLLIPSMPLLMSSPVRASAPTVTLLPLTWPPEDSQFVKDGNQTQVWITFRAHVEAPDGIDIAWLYCYNIYPINKSMNQVDFKEKDPSKIKFERRWFADGNYDISNTTYNNFTTQEIDGFGNPIEVAHSLLLSADLTESVLLDWNDISTDKGFRYYFYVLDQASAWSSAPPMPDSGNRPNPRYWTGTTEEEGAAAKLPPNGVTTQEPMMTHVPLTSMKTNETANITTVVRSKDGPKGTLFYKGVEDTKFSSIGMTEIDRTGDLSTFKAKLPAQKKVGILQYYLKASNSTRTETNPLKAPDETHSVSVGTDLRLVALYPGVGDVNVPKDLTTTDRPAITITFSEDLDPTCVVATNVKVYYYKEYNIELTKVNVDGTLSYDEKTNTVKFVPAAPLPPAKKVYVWLSTGLRNKDRSSWLTGEVTAWFQTLPDLTVKVVTVQVVEGADLVKDKRTVVRVFAQWPEEQGYALKSFNATVLLKVDGSEVARIERKEFKPSSAMKATDLSHGKLSANFDSQIHGLSFISSPGQHTLEAIVIPNPCHSADPYLIKNSTKVTVRTTLKGNPYTVMYFPLGVGNFSTTKEQDISWMALQGDDLLVDTFPIASSTSGISSTVEPEPTISWAIPNTVVNWQPGPANKYRWILASLSTSTEVSGIDRKVAVVPIDWLNKGQNWDGTHGIELSEFPYAVLVEDWHGQSWSQGAYGHVDGRKDNQPTIVVHELGHTYGLEHPTSDLELQGYNVRRGMPENAPEAGAMLNNLMKAEPDRVSESWIRSDDYKALLEKFASGASRADPSTSILISGFLGNYSALLPMLELELAPNAKDLVPGNVTVLLLDRAGTTLNTYNLKPGDLGSGLHYFAFRADRPEGLWTVVLKNGSTEVARVNRSISAPVVSVTGPSGQVSGTVGVTWTASDVDGNPLNYSVLWCPDGRSCDSISWGGSNTTLPVNTAGLAGRTGRFRVLATDGFNTASAESPTVTLSGRDPVVYITSPNQTSSYFETGEDILLSASAYDINDGRLDGATLAWSSDLSGALGTGSALRVNLTQGSHRITVTAKTLDGRTGTGAITVNVASEQPSQPPEEKKDYWVVLSASDFNKNNGQVTLSWFGSFPKTGSLAILEKSSGLWERVDTLEGFTSTQYSVTGLTAEAGSYDFALAILDKDGVRVYLSDPVTVGTGTVVNPKPSKPPPSGPCSMIPVVVPLMVISIVVPWRAKRRPKGPGQGGSPYLRN